MQENHKNTWLALCEINDYFSRLSGAARPHGMSEPEIPLYVACKILELNDANFPAEEFLHPSFINAITPIMENVGKLISNILITDIELFPFLIEFYEYESKKLGNEMSLKWKEFGVFLKRNRA